MGGLADAVAPAERRRFTAAEGVGRGIIAEYHTAAGGVPFVLRHGTPDVEVFEEIFVQRLYEPPPGMPEPARAVDLGANIGLFGVYLRELYPHVPITAFEPDPDNLALLRRCVELNGGEWEIVEACAGVTTGLVPFVAGDFHHSRLATGAVEEGSIVVPIVDVIPYLDGIDLLKVDIQGAEWPIFTDPRFAAAGVRAICAEYHPFMCPRPDAPLAAARELLEAAGYEVDVVFDDPAGHGMLWALRRS